MKTLTLVLTEDCNCNCVYCFQKILKNKENEGTFFELKKLEKILKDISQIQFFGGEATLKDDIIMKLDSYIKDLIKLNYLSEPIKYIISSNLVEFSDEFKIFLKQNYKNIKFITSVDGPKKIHDYNRKYNNQSSFDQIYLNNNFLMENNIELSLIVGVYNQIHLNNSCTLLETIEDISSNFPNAKFIQLVNEILVPSLKIPFKEFFDMKINTLEIIFNMIKKKDISIKKYAPYLNKILIDLISDNTSKVLNNKMCRSQGNKITIFPNGNIYTCPDEYYLNRLPKNILSISNETNEYFLENNFSNEKKRECSNCKYNLICSVCPIKDRIKSECDFNKIYFNFIFNNLKEIFSKIDLISFLKINCNISAINIKNLYLLIKSIER